MDFFQYENGELHAESVPVSKIIKQVGTPTYVYSRATLERHWHAFNDAFADHPHLVCYAVKANSNLAVLNLMARLGSGFDIVSAGELRRVIKAGGDPAKVVFSGVGKTIEEMRFALAQNISCFNVESEAELVLLDQVATEMGKVAPVAIRVNPDVDAKTHPYISTGLKENKFGVAIDHAENLYQQMLQMPGIKITGVACHIGSQLTDLNPFLDALDRVLALVDGLAEQNVHLQHIDLGGGLGVRYKNESPPLPADYSKALMTRLARRKEHIHIEPGRAIAANAGIFVSEVLYLKQNEEKQFAIIDGAMNDLIRPTLYSAWMEAITVQQKDHSDAPLVDIVGPVCETGDFLAKQRALNLQQGDLVALRSAGAYGFTMSSNYNSRNRAAEVMVDDDQFFVVRERECFEDLIKGEHCLD
ncbi:MAG: diaminopimelate decarboxylase [Gammaproteobacteria bacterium]|nr:diaminopimelate decarboxylase [Gammaproteobacteria bacterium]